MWRVVIYMVILVIHNIKIGKKQLLNVRLAGDHLWRCCSDGSRWWCLWWCLFVLSFSPRDVLDETLDLMESVS